MERREQAPNIPVPNSRSDFCIKCRIKTENKNEVVVDKIDKNGCTRKILKSLCVMRANKGCCMKGSKVVKPTQPRAGLASNESHVGEMDSKDLYVNLRELPEYLQKMIICRE